MSTCISARIMQYQLLSGPPILTSTKFRSRLCTSPNIDQNQDKNPNNVNKVPIKSSKLQSNTLMSIRRFYLEHTYNKIKPSNQNVESVKSSSLIECRTKSRITKSKSSFSIFQILTKQENNSLKYSDSKKQRSFLFLIAMHSMKCCVTSKVTPLQNKSVCKRQCSPIYRNNTYRRPTHSNLNSRHQCTMKSSPKKSNKKSSFRNNELQHSQMLSIFDFPSMKTKNTFTINITPPNTSTIHQCTKSSSHKSSSSCILMKKQYLRCGQPQKTKPSQSRPRTWVYLMISVMGPHRSSACPSSIRTVEFLRCQITSFLLIFLKQRKQSHYFYKKKEKQKRKKKRQLIYYTRVFLLLFKLLWVNILLNSWKTKNWLFILYEPEIYCSKEILEKLNSNPKLLFAIQRQNQ